MIKNVIIHFMSDRPLRVELFEKPKADDVSVICTNVQTLEYTQPTFIEDSKHVFVFPLHNIRFVEITETGEMAEEAKVEEEEETVDEELLKRLGEFLRKA